MQWVEAHRCTHRDSGVLCHAVLSPNVWKRAKQDAWWPEDEPLAPAAWTAVEQQAARQLLYDAIERALQPAALDWDKIYETKQRQGERASEFMHRLVQAFLQYGGFQVEE